MTDIIKMLVNFMILLQMMTLQINKSGTSTFQIHTQILLTGVAAW